MISQLQQRVRLAEVRCTDDKTMYTTARNTSNRLIKKEKTKIFEKFEKSKGDQKSLWKITNRSKGIVTKKVESLTEQKYCPESMAQFFEDRSKIAIHNKSNNTDEKIALITEDEKIELNIDVSNEEIDFLMKYKPARTADPDTLSTHIWSNIYSSNLNYREAILHLFKKSFLDEFKIPGLF